MSSDLDVELGFGDDVDVSEYEPDEDEFVVEDDEVPLGVASRSPTPRPSRRRGTRREHSPDRKCAPPAPLPGPLVAHGVTQPPPRADGGDALDRRRRRTSIVRRQRTAAPEGARAHLAPHAGARPFGNPWPLRGAAVVFPRQQAAVPSPSREKRTRRRLGRRASVAVASAADVAEDVETRACLLLNRCVPSGERRQGPP